MFKNLFRKIEVGDIYVYLPDLITFERDQQFKVVSINPTCDLIEIENVDQNKSSLVGKFHLKSTFKTKFKLYKKYDQ